MNPLIGIGTSLLGGLFGGGSPEPAYAPQQEWAMRFLKKIARGYLQDSKSIPMSLPQEQMALAQTLGLMGEQGRGAYQQLLGVLGTNGPTSESAGDALVRFQEGQTGNQMAATQQALLQSLMQRQNFRAMAGQTAGQVAGIAGSPAAGLQGGGTDLSGLFQALGVALGQRGGLGGQSATYRPPVGTIQMSSPATAQRPDYHDPSMPLYF